MTADAIRERHVALAHEMLAVSKVTEMLDCIDDAVSIEKARADAGAELNVEALTRLGAAEADAAALAETGDHHADCDLNLRPDAATARCDCIWGPALAEHEELVKP